MALARDSADRTNYMRLSIDRRATSTVVSCVEALANPLYWLWTVLRLLRSYGIRRQQTT